MAFLDVEEVGKVRRAGWRGASTSPPGHSTINGARLEGKLGTTGGSSGRVTRDSLAFLGVDTACPGREEHCSYLESQAAREYY